MRPIASGAVSPGLALAVAAVLGLAALGGAFTLGFSFFAIAATYLVLLTCYSALSQAHRHSRRADDCRGLHAARGRRRGGDSRAGQPLADRVHDAAGSFLALSKRRHELVLLTDTATDHRPILGDYTPYLLDQMISVVTASTLIAYAFYTISPETTEKFGTDLLSLTIPFPLYGIFRYLYLVHRRDQGGSPAELLVNDRPLLVCVGSVGARGDPHHLPVKSWPCPRLGSPS